MLNINGSRKFVNLAILFAFILLFVANVAAQQNGNTISGTVKDPEEAVVAGATVAVINIASGRETIVESSESGAYQIGQLTAGDYLVQVRKSGFSSTSDRITLGDGETKTLDVVLRVGSFAEQVTVTAARGLRATAEIPQTVTTISAEEIERRRPISIANTYEKAPSVLAIDPNPFRSRPQIRGLQSSRVLVTVDGDRLNNSRFTADIAGITPALVDISQIQTVEVVNGSASSLYGSDSIGGTINIITKGPARQPDGRRFDFQFSGDYGNNNNYGRGSAQIGFGTDKFGISGNFGRFVFPDYKVGGEAISRADTTRYGDFVTRVGQSVGQNVISSYAVFDLAPNARIPNSGARGSLGGLDLIVYPNEKQDLRVRYQVNGYRNLGVPFSSRPFNVNELTTDYNNFDKFSTRYEIREVLGFLPRISLNVFRQQYSRNQRENRFSIQPGSSFRAAVGATPAAFTGNPSVFVPNQTFETISNNITSGFDAQFNIIPFKNLFYTTGVNLNNDDSRDTVRDYNPTTGALLSIVDRRNVPNATYRNLGYYNQLEYTPIKYLRLTGGFRLDNWRTEARPTSGFALGNAPTFNLPQIIARSIPVLRASNQTTLNVEGVEGIERLTSGAGSITTNNNVLTYNVSATVISGYGINPYIRYSTSYREPDLLSRYLVRTYTNLPFLATVNLTNTALRPERGRDFEVGFKASTNRVRGSFSYYRNQLNDAIGFATGAVNINAAGIPGTTQAPIFPVQLLQSINFSKVLIQGVEGEIEGEIPLSRFGVITPYFSFSTINAENQRPDATRLAVVRNFYNSNAPLELEGSESDVPFNSLPNYKTVFSPRFTTRNNFLFAEYEWLFTSRVTRVDPNDLSTAQVTQYAYFEGYRGINRHSIRGGIRFGENVPITITLGLENLTNNLYFLPQQAAPAQGRSFTIGTTINFSKIF